MTKMNAWVRVLNKSGEEMIDVKVVHKYSGVYLNEKSWENVPVSKYTEGALKVEYNTGFLTTGRDWWFIAWNDEEGNTHISSPSNGRGFVDGLEDIAGDLFKKTSF